MEIKQEIIDEVLNRLFDIFEKNDVSCDIFEKNGWRRINIKKDFKSISQSVKENDPNIYKIYNLINFYMEIAEAIFSGKDLTNVLTYITLSSNPKEIEEMKLKEFINFINIYEKYNHILPKDKILKDFYKYCKNYVDKDMKTQDLYKKFKEKKLQIPAQDKKLNIKKLDNYMRSNGSITLCCKITNFNYITVSYKNLWKYYYLSLVAEEPLLFINLNTNKKEEIHDLFY